MDGQRNVESWTDIVAVSAGGYSAVGIKRDGTVVVAGKWAEAFNYDGWYDIEFVTMDYDYILGVRNDGTTVVNIAENCDYLGTWENVATASICDSHFIAVGYNGVAVAECFQSDYEDGECYVDEWTDIKSPD